MKNGRDCRKYNRLNCSIFFAFFAKKERYTEKITFSEGDDPMVKRLLAGLSGLFFPARCPYCGNVMDAKALSCNDCKILLRRIDRPVCTVCNIEIESYHRTCNGFPCAVPFSYQGVVRKALLNFKFHQKVSYARPFAGEIAALLRRFSWEKEIDLITFVPMWPQKERTRGYNQAAVLAKTLAREIGSSCVPLLKKLYDNGIQHSLTAVQRRKNVKGAFGLLQAETVNDKVILLCDDVMTTGATLQECASLLYKNGAKKVYCAAIAHREVVS